MEKAFVIFQNSGVKVEEVSFPTEFDDEEALKRMQNIIISGEARVVFLMEYRMDKTKLHPEIRRLVENRSDYTRNERMQALDRHARMRFILDEIADNYTAIITPSALDEAPFGLDDTGSAAFNIGD